MTSAILASAVDLILSKLDCILLSSAAGAGSRPDHLWYNDTAQMAGEA
jgi:hypothetical protein